MQNQPSSKWQDIYRRAVVVVIGAPLTLLLLYLGFPYFDLLIIIIHIISAFECANLTGHTTQTEKIAVLLLFFSVFILTAYQQCLISVISLTIATAIMIISPTARQKPFIYPYLGALYIGIANGLLPVIRTSFPDGLHLVALLLITNWSTDLFALLGGRWIGKTPLLPRISPKKTREGTLIGLICGILFGSIVGISGNLMLPIAIIYCTAIAIMTVLGDILESWAKRYFDVKDAGSILPGHGGFIDRMDGLYLSTPIYWLLLLLLQHQALH